MVRAVPFSPRDVATSVADAASVSAWEAAGRLGLALLLGALIGAQRELDGRPAGLRTHALLALATALFGLLSVGAFTGFVTERADTNVQVDVTRIASYVVAGVGFIAGGTIVKNGKRDIHGLTTAAALLLAAAAGLACGLGAFAPALIATGITVAVLLLDVPVQRASARLRRTRVGALITGADPAAPEETKAVDD